MIEQKDLTVQLLEKVLLDLDDKKIKKMSEQANKLAKPDATKMISDYLMSVD